MANSLLGNAGNVEKLTGRQRFHWTRFLRPLLEDVPCQGVFGPETCAGNGLVEEESLLISYQQSNFPFQHCRYEKDKLQGNKS